jgi:hypothetical protein
LGLSIWAFYGEQRKYSGAAERILEDSRKAARVSTEIMRERVTVGMTKDYVQQVLGEPDSTREISNGDSRLELWYYQCDDGKVQISILDGKVQSVKQ